MKPIVQLKNLLSQMPKAVADGIHDLLLSPDAAEVVRKGSSRIPESIDEDNRIAEQIVSTPHVDRDDEIVDPSGLDLKIFRMNPICLWSHNYSIPAIGSDIEFGATPKGFRVKTAYASTPFAQEIFTLKKEGHLRASSIGFIPIERVFKGEVGFSDNLTRVSNTYGVDPSGAEVITTKCLLLEHSDCNIPANPFALMLSLGKGSCPDSALNTELQNICVKALEGQSEVIDKVLHSGLDTPQITAILLEAMDVTEKPYPNEHACRLQDPGKFSAMRRGSREHDGKKYSIIFGKVKDGETWEEQAYRYSKDTWTAADARAHCKAHKGSFEPASEESRAIVRRAIVKNTRFIRKISSKPIDSKRDDSLRRIIRSEIKRIYGQVESASD